MDGLELALEIQRRPVSAQTAVVLLTSASVENERAEHAGVKHRLLKPPRQSDLYGIIREALAVPSSHRVRREELPSTGDEDEGPLVLIAEDNEVNQLVAKTLLERHGLRTEVARTGLEAVAMSAAREYAAIFMDCQMPDLDGYQATARIRAARSDRRTPIVAMTANSMPEDRERCLAAGMDDYLSKPIEPDKLEALLARWLPSDGYRPARTART
jgi:two-component system sensor histidine kinase/response regulator